ncbi:DUF551 domain-containing protein, partial [Mesorhizobium sp.]|uniref:DUF551 domain-containing protein n=1 Tax=Mesorhizobium sp. TaxID=1871066 RepID=UPI003459BEB8
APKDDTEVMLHDGVRPGFGHYWYPADLIDQGHWYGTRVHRPTHWRPLPKPPVQS